MFAMCFAIFISILTKLNITKRFFKEPGVFWLFDLVQDRVASTLYTKFVFGTVMFISIYVCVGVLFYWTPSAGPAVTDILFHQSRYVVHSSGTFIGHQNPIPTAMVYDSAKLPFQGGGDKFKVTITPSACAGLTYGSGLGACLSSFGLTQSALVTHPTPDGILNLNGFNFRAPLHTRYDTLVEYSSRKGGPVDYSARFDALVTVIPPQDVAMTILTPGVCCLPAAAPLRQPLCVQLKSLAGIAEAGFKVVVSASDVHVRLSGAVAFSNNSGIVCFPDLKVAASAVSSFNIFIYGGGSRKQWGQHAFTIASPRTAQLQLQLQSGQQLLPVQGRIKLMAGTAVNLLVSWSSSISLSCSAFMLRVPADALQLPPWADQSPLPNPSRVITDLSCTDEQAAYQASEGGGSFQGQLRLTARTEPLLPAPSNFTLGLYLDGVLVETLPLQLLSPCLETSGLSGSGAVISLPNSTDGECGVGQETFLQLQPLSALGKMLSVGSTTNVTDIDPFLLLSTYYNASSITAVCGSDALYYSVNIVASGRDQAAAWLSGAGRGWKQQLELQRCTSERVSSCVWDKNGGVTLVRTSAALGRLDPLLKRGATEVQFCAKTWLWNSTFPSCNASTSPVFVRVGYSGSALTPPLRVPCPSATATALLQSASPTRCAIVRADPAALNPLLITTNGTATIILGVPLPLPQLGHLRLYNRRGQSLSGGAFAVGLQVLESFPSSVVAVVSSSSTAGTPMVTFMPLGPPDAVAAVEATNMGLAIGLTASTLTDARTGGVSLSLVPGRGVLLTASSLLDPMPGRVVITATSNSSGNSGSCSSAPRGVLFSSPVLQSSISPPSELSCIGGVVQSVVVTVEFEPSAAARLRSAGVPLTVEMSFHGGAAGVGGNISHGSALIDSNNVGKVVLSGLRPITSAADFLVHVSMVSPIPLALAVLDAACPSPTQQLALLVPPPLSSALHKPFFPAPVLASLDGSGVPIANTSVLADCSTLGVLLSGTVSNSSGAFPVLSFLSAPTGCHSITFRAAGSPNVFLTTAPVCIINPLGLLVTNPAANFINATNSTNSTGNGNVSAGCAGVTLPHLSPPVVGCLHGVPDVMLAPSQQPCLQPSDPNVAAALCGSNSSTLCYLSAEVTHANGSPLVNGGLLGASVPLSSTSSATCFTQLTLAGVKQTGSFLLHFSLAGQRAANATLLLSLGRLGPPTVSFLSQPPILLPLGVSFPIATSVKGPGGGPQPNTIVDITLIMLSLPGGSSTTSNSSRAQLLSVSTLLHPFLSSLHNTIVNNSTAAQSQVVSALLSAAFPPWLILAGMSVVSSFSSSNGNATAPSTNPTASFVQLTQMLNLPGFDVQLMAGLGRILFQYLLRRVLISLEQCVTQGLGLTASQMGVVWVQLGALATAQQQISPAALRALIPIATAAARNSTQPVVTAFVGYLTALGGGNTLSALSSLNTMLSAVPSVQSQVFTNFTAAFKTGLAASPQFAGGYRAETQLLSAVVTLRTVFPTFLNCSKATLVTSANQSAQLLALSVSGAVARFRTFLADVKAGVGPISLPQLLMSVRSPKTMLTYLEQVLEPGGAWSWKLKPILAMSEMQHLTDGNGQTTGTITCNQGSSGLYAVHIIASGPGGRSSALSRPFFLENPLTAVTAVGGAAAIGVQQPGFAAPAVALRLVSPLQRAIPPLTGAPVVTVDSAVPYPIQLGAVGLHIQMEASAPLSVQSRGCLDMQVKVQRNSTVSGFHPHVAQMLPKAGHVPCGFELTPAAVTMTGANGGNYTYLPPLPSTMPFCPLELLGGDTGDYEALLYCDGVPSDPLPFSLKNQNSPLFGQMWFLVGKASAGFWTTLLLGLVAVTPLLFFNTISPRMTVSRWAVVANSFSAQGFMVLLLALLFVTGFNIDMTKFMSGYETLISFNSTSLSPVLLHLTPYPTSFGVGLVLLMGIFLGGMWSVATHRLILIISWKQALRYTLPAAFLCFSISPFGFSHSPGYFSLLFFFAFALSGWDRHTTTLSSGDGLALDAQLERRHQELLQVSDDTKRDPASSVAVIAAANKKLQQFERSMPGLRAFLFAMQKRKVQWVEVGEGQRLSATLVRHITLWAARARGQVRERKQRQKQETVSTALGEQQMLDRIALMNRAIKEMERAKFIYLSSRKRLAAHPVVTACLEALVALVIYSSFSAVTLPLPSIRNLAETWAAVLAVLNLQLRVQGGLRSAVALLCLIMLLLMIKPTPVAPWEFPLQIFMLLLAAGLHTVLLSCGPALRKRPSPRWATPAWSPVSLDPLAALGYNQGRLMWRWTVGFFWLLDMALHSIWPLLMLLLLTGVLLAVGLRGAPILEAFRQVQRLRQRVISLLQLWRGLSVLLKCYAGLYTCCLCFILFNPGVDATLGLEIMLCLHCGIMTVRAFTQADATGRFTLRYKPIAFLLFMLQEVRIALRQLLQQRSTLSHFLRSGAAGAKEEDPTDIEMKVMETDEQKMRRTRLARFRRRVTDTFTDRNTELAKGSVQLRFAALDHTAVGGFRAFADHFEERLANSYRLVRALLSPAAVEPPPPSPCPLKEDPVYKKYLLMRQPLIPRAAVIARMQAQRLDPSLLDTAPDSSGTEEREEEDPVAPFRAMLQPRASEECIRIAMKSEGLDPANLDGPLDLPVGASLEEELVQEMEELRGSGMEGMKALLRLVLMNLRFIPYRPPPPPPDNACELALARHASLYLPQRLQIMLVLCVIGVTTLTLGIMVWGQWMFHWLSKSGLSAFASFQQAGSSSAMQHQVFDGWFGVWMLLLGQLQLKLGFSMNFLVVMRSCVWIAALLAYLQVLFHLKGIVKLYRARLLGMRKGQHFFPVKEVLLTDATKYIGYQCMHMFAAYYAALFLFGILVLIVVPGAVYQSRRNFWLGTVLKLLVEKIVPYAILYIALALVYRVVFTDPTTFTLFSLRLRRGWGLVDYLGIYTYLVGGVIIVISRIIAPLKAALISAWRLDNPVTQGNGLNDLGFHSYASLLLGDHLYHNPVLVVCVDLLARDMDAARLRRQQALEEHRDKKNSGVAWSKLCGRFMKKDAVAGEAADLEAGEAQEQEQEQGQGNVNDWFAGERLSPDEQEVIDRHRQVELQEQHRRAIRFKWHVLLTLARNPKLQFWRRRWFPERPTVLPSGGVLLHDWANPLLQKKVAARSSTSNASSVAARGRRMSTKLSLSARSFFTDRSVGGRDNSSSLPLQNQVLLEEEEHVQDVQEDGSMSAFPSLDASAAVEESARSQDRKALPPPQPPTGSVRPKRRLQQQQEEEDVCPVPLLLALIAEAAAEESSAELQSPPLPPESNLLLQFDALGMSSTAHAAAAIPTAADATTDAAVTRPTMALPEFVQGGGSERPHKRGRRQKPDLFAWQVVAALPGAAAAAPNPLATGKSSSDTSNPTASVSAAPAFASATDEASVGATSTTTSTSTGVASFESPAAEIAQLKLKQEELVAQARAQAWAEAEAQAQAKIAHLRQMHAVVLAQAQKEAQQAQQAQAQSEVQIAELTRMVAGLTSTGVSGQTNALPALQSREQSQSPVQSLESVDGKAAAAVPTPFILSPHAKSLTSTTMQPTGGVVAERIAVFEASSHSP